MIIWEPRNQTYIVLVETKLNDSENVPVGGENAMYGGETEIKRREAE